MSILSTVPNGASGLDVRDTINNTLARLLAAEAALGITSTPQSYSDARARLTAANGALVLPGTPGFDFKRDSINQDYAVQATQNNSVWRFECREGDGNSGGAGTDRSEIVGDFSSTKINNNVPFKQKVWQSFSQRVSGTLSTNSAHFVVANQWHGAQEATEASLSPPLSFAFAGTSFRIATLWDDNVTQTSSTDTHFQGRYYDNNFPLNTWINWVVAVTFDFNNPGVGTLEVWRNGTKVINLSGISLGFNDPRGPRLQFGVYRSQNYPGTLVVEYANMEVSYDSLFGRVYNPRAIPPFA